MRNGTYTDDEVEELPVVGHVDLRVGGDLGQQVTTTRSIVSALLSTFTKGHDEGVLELALQVDSSGVALGSVEPVLLGVVILRDRRQQRP